MSLINSVNNTEKSTIINDEKIKTVINIFCKDISKLNILDECGWTPLYRTIIAGDLFASKILLSKGADPNIQCSMGETPLYQAVDMGKLDHVKLLINSGANPNIAQEDGISPLHSAVIRQNLLIVKFLLKNGADPNIKTKIYNQSPVHLAIKNDVDPMILLLLVQFNGSLLDRDKFDKRPIDYINSKEMNDAIEKLKFGKNQINDKKLHLCPPLFQTPKKYKNWEISKVFSNTIRSKSSKKDIIFNSKTLLKEPGYLKYNIIETNKKEIINLKEKLKDNNIINNSNKEYDLKGKENREPNIRKERLSFISGSSQKEESSCIESEKGENDNLIINDSYFIKNKNNQYQCNIDNFNVIYIDNLSKNIRSNNGEKLECNNLSKIPKIRFYNSNENEKNIDNLKKSKKNSFSLINKSQNDSSNNISFKESIKSNKSIQSNKLLYIKPILSLNESNSKKININNKEIKNENEEDENEDIKRIFTFMEKEKGNNKKDNSTIYDMDKNILNKPIEIDRIKTSAITLSNTNGNNTSTLNDEFSINYLWKFKTLDDDCMFHNKRNSENTSLYSYNIDISNQNAKYPIYEWLDEINLVRYYNNFIVKKIYNLDKLIYNLKNGLCNITKNDIEKLGISIPGHVYRIITKMEIDSERISSKISSLLLGIINKDSNINILKNSVYYCCGCCSIQNQSRYYNNDNSKKFQLEQWLSKLRMNKYKNNFINNGFDMFEYFILQMFSSIPVDENILKEDIKIKNIKDRDFILLQINKDIKYIIKKSEKSVNNSMIEIILEQNKNKIEQKDNTIIEKQTEENEEDSNCILF